MDESQKDSSASALALSAAHSIALVARMLTVEEDCREMERFLDGYSGIFYAYVGVLPDEVRQTIRTLISQILEGINRIRLDLGLPQRQVEVTRLFAAHLSRIWVTLCESKGDSLRGYGEVPEELTAYLEPRVEELLGLVQRLRSAIESGKTPFSAGGVEGELG
jgi:hypothetical protein